MNESLCNENGSPTEAGLKLLAEWNVVIEDVSVMLRVIEQMWHGNKKGYKLSGKRVQHLELHTAGLPGNEEIIVALQQNTIFWGRYWKTHKKGGHYFFTIRPMRLIFVGEVISRTRRKWNYTAPGLPEGFLNKV
ncbi:MAG: hypothetical protein ACOYMF_08400 [Bacteroidales bacterium]